MIKGIGLGLRFPHFDSILKEDCETSWFEVLTDDFLNQGPHFKKLERLRETKPIVMHSIGMNLGGVSAFNQNYLSSLRELYKRFEPEWISDHLCWSSHEGQYHHDLLPIPRTDEALENLVQRVSYLQDFFGRQLVLENITSYVEFEESHMPETEFINALVDKTGCGILLDLTNVLVNSQNKKTSVKEYIENFPFKAVKQIHLAGGEYIDDVLVDTHGANVGDEDIELLKEVYKKHSTIPAMIERDIQLPSFEELEAERKKIEGAVHGL